MRCPACGASGLEDVGHLLRCARCLNEFDRKLRPYGPMRSDPRPLPPPISEDSMPTMASAAGDPTEIDLSDEIPTDPLAGAARGVFAAPPRQASSTFAAPPPTDALARDAKEKKWSRALGDGGPPVGLDLLVLVLAGLDLMSMGVWWRSNVPLANAMLLPLLGSLFVTYFFWKGRNWARFLLLLGSLVELVGLSLAFVALRRHLTGVELVVMGIRVVLDGWIVWFCVRPDTVAYFEKRRR